jgi:dimethylargininase
VEGALHLKTACTAVDSETVLLNPVWVDPGDFEGYRVVEVDPEEPFGANLLPLDDHVLVSAAAPRTAARLSRIGVEVQTLEISEFEKAEGGMTCLSLRRG